MTAAGYLSVSGWEKTVSKCMRFGSIRWWVWFVSADARGRNRDAPAVIAPAVSG
ncbi:hypothetical protein SCA03_22320 [Streptomyces cacaoi]|uniref:Uncharacterized protein n=1 Tax=Streptomyces cacaoi TaxID=1898 RepID=A0A4Y3QWR2_STRCI|nr:hypothetical protein SCA03_22320 [Streptomyces cacaoi]